jgi:hypothetical protein
LFYEISITGGRLKTGTDPEIQIIEAVRFMDYRDIKEMPPKVVHGIFRFADTADDLKHLTGFHRI